MKNQLKEAMLEKRDILSREEIIPKSQKIAKNLFALSEFKKSKTAVFFVSFGSEVHTHEMIAKALKAKTVAVPKVINNEIVPSIIHDLENLVEGKFRILEPMDSIKVSSKSIDVVIVPGLAFDLNGHRVGYGFGYYDRFLRTVPKAAKIGLCFDFQLVEKIENHELDVPVDFIVTEGRVIEC